MSRACRRHTRYRLAATSPCGHHRGGARCRSSTRRTRRTLAPAAVSRSTPSSRARSTDAPRDVLPEGEMPPDVAYQIIHDELMLDGNARLNLATFVTHVDGAAGREAHGRVLRQEHDRQGRVPADRGARDALRAASSPPLARARRRRRRPAARRPARARRRCSAGSRSSAAGSSGARPRASRPTSPTSSWASTSRSAGRSSPTTGTSRCASSRWRATASTSRPRRP